MRGDKGFSLFEVTAVAIVVLALSAITVPGMYSVYSSYKLSTTTETVSAMLQTARARAMRDGKSVTVIFNSSIHQFGIDENGDGRLEAEESFAAPDGISFQPYVSITFMPNGELPAGVTSAAVTISNGSESRSINVMRDGQIEIS